MEVSTQDSDIGMNLPFCIQVVLQDRNLYEWAENDTLFSVIPPSQVLHPTHSVSYCKLPSFIYIYIYIIFFVLFYI